MTPVLHAFAFPVSRAAALRISTSPRVGYERQEEPWFLWAISRAKPPRAEDCLPRAPPMANRSFGTPERETRCRRRPGRLDCGSSRPLTSPSSTSVRANCTVFPSAHAREAAIASGIVRNERDHDWGRPASCGAMLIRPRSRPRNPLAPARHDAGQDQFHSSSTALPNTPATPKFRSPASIVGRTFRGPSRFPMPRDGRLAQLAHGQHSRGWPASQTGFARGVSAVRSPKSIHDGLPFPLRPRSIRPPAPLPHHGNAIGAREYFPQFVGDEKDGVASTFSAWNTLTAPAAFVRTAPCGAV